MNIKNDKVYYNTMNEMISYVEDMVLLVFFRLKT